MDEFRVFDLIHEHYDRVCALVALLKDTPVDKISIYEYDRRTSNSKIRFEVIIDD